MITKREHNKRKIRELFNYNNEPYPKPFLNFCCGCGAKIKNRKVYCKDCWKSQLIDYYPFRIKYEDFVVPETDPEKIKRINREKKLERIIYNKKQ